MKKSILCMILSLGGGMLKGSGLSVTISQEEQCVLAIRDLIKAEPAQFDQRYFALKEWYKSALLDIDRIEVEDCLVPGRASLGAQLDALVAVDADLGPECQAYHKTQAKILAALVYEQRSCKAQARHPEDMLKELIAADINDPLDLANNDGTGRNSTNKQLRRFFEAGAYNIWEIEIAPGEETIFNFLIRRAAEASCSEESASIVGTLAR